MPDLSQAEKIKLAVSLIEQSPPGEVNDVVTALRAIINDDAALMPEAEVALRSYNLAQLQVVQHEDHKSLLSEAVILPSTSSEERFIDPEAARSFTFDHVTLTPSNYEPYVLPEKEAEFAKLLSASWAKYARNHYPSGVASVSTNQVPVPNAAEAEDNVAATPASEDLASPEAGSSLPGDPVGATELAPTPVVGDKVVSGDDEVDRADGLQKLDKEMEEVKEEEEAEDNATALTPRDEMPSGVIEAEPTPVTGEKALDGTDEVDREGGLENLDGEMEEVKEETEDQREEDTSEREAEVQVVRDLAEQRADVAQREPIVAVEAKPQLKPLDNPTYTLEIVGNKYSPTNYWTGRWRTRWTVEGSTVNGLINVDIHYYEQGNVQLSTHHSASFPLPSETGQALASQIVTNIAKIETEYQLELGDVYADLGDRAFRSLRRALPVTRQKIDWDKVSGYNLGSDISKGRA